MFDLCDFFYLSEAKSNRRSARSVLFDQPPPPPPPQIKGMRGALKRVLGDEEGGGTGDDSMSEEDVASLASQLREARSLLREQDAIMFAAIFDRCGTTFLCLNFLGDCVPGQVKSHAPHKVPHGEHRGAGCHHPA